MSGNSYVPTYRHRRENPYTERVHRIYVRQLVPQKVLEDITPSLVDVATRAGYTIISHNGLTVMELAGNGEWERVEKACRRFILHTHFGHAYDHYTVVVRSEDGTRELRDVGVNGVRYGDLPPVGHKEKRKYDGCGVKGARADGKRFRCQMTVHGVKLYLGMYDTAEEAGRVRDRYVITHDLRVPLNYPGEVMA